MRLFLVTTLLLLSSSQQIHADGSQDGQVPKECGWAMPKFTFPEDSHNYEEFPWLVAIFSSSFSVNSAPVDYIASGTLIHPSAVLTVAHKFRFRNPDEIACRAGLWDMVTTGDVLFQDRAVRKIVSHDEANYLHAYYDTALLFLASPFILKDTPHISVACLGRSMPAPDTVCFSVGWNSYMGYSSLWEMAAMYLVDPEECQRLLRRTRYGTKYSLHHTLTCARGSDRVYPKVPCFSDGGAPLMCPIQVNSNSNTRYAVYGLGAYGESCKHKMPMVFAKIPSMIDWIDQEMDKEKLNHTTYLV